MDKQRGLGTLLAQERGATAVEYGLVAALVVLASIAGFSALASTTSNMWDDVAENVDANGRR